MPRHTTVTIDKEVLNLATSSVASAVEVQIIKTLSTISKLSESKVVLYFSMKIELELITLYSSEFSSNFGQSTNSLFGGRLTVAVVVVAAVVVSGIGWCWLTLSRFVSVTVSELFFVTDVVVLIKIVSISVVINANSSNIIELIVDINLEEIEVKLFDIFASVVDAS